jgi:hypothetical protein
MTVSTRNSEFAVGVGTAVYVDMSRYLHRAPDCEKFFSKKLVGIYATEKTARSAIPGIRPCKHCR